MFFLVSLSTCLKGRRSNVKWNMLVDSEVLSLSVPEQYFAFSEAYIDSACRLCTVLARSSNKATYARGSVVLYLSFHATELFLKGAILYKSPQNNIESTHNIEKLYNRYLKIYTKKKYKFKLLFKSNEPDFSGIEPDLIKQLKLEIKKLNKNNPSDQRYRYPQNTKGALWQGIQGFEASSFLLEIKQLREELNAISKQISN